MKDSISRQLLRQAATEQGYAVSEPGDDEYFLKVSHPSGKTILFRGTLNNRNSAIGSLVARHKQLSLNFFEDNGISMPPYCLYESETQAEDFLAQHGVIVVKPTDSSQSKGVTVGISNKADLLVAVTYAMEHTRNKKVILQKQLQGKLYRLLVVNGKLVAAALRRAPEVNGNGKDTIRQLLEYTNQDSRRSDRSDTPLKTIKLSDVESYLGVDKIDSVPKNGEKVRISALDSVSAGGEATDVTDEVNIRHRELAEWVSTNLDLYVSGIDIMTEDISLPPPEGYWPLLEINSGPGLKLHYFPTGGGAPRDVAGDIMRDLFQGIV